MICVVQQNIHGTMHNLYWCSLALCAKNKLNTCTIHDIYTQLKTYPKGVKTHYLLSSPLSTEDALSIMALTFKNGNAFKPTRAI